MITAVIPCLDAERTLGECLGALTQAAIHGLVRQVVIADGGSIDASLAIAEDAGAEVVLGGAELGFRLAAGCAAARQPWMLVLDQSARLMPGWEAVIQRHIEVRPDQAAWFALRQQAGLVGLLTGLAGPRQPVGLLIPRPAYDRAGGFGLGRDEAGLAARVRAVRIRPPVLTPRLRRDPAAR